MTMVFPTFFWASRQALSVYAGAFTSASVGHQFMDRA